MKKMLIGLILCGYIMTQTVNQREYPGFEIVVNENPYPVNLFIHSMSEGSRYMAILDSGLNQLWSVNSGALGFDFKVNDNDQVTYFSKQEEFWISMSRTMIETDTVQCANNLLTDYHDIRFLPSGGYILQAFQQIIIDMSTLENGYENALVQQLVIQEFNSDDEVIFEWAASDHLEISYYTNLNLTAPEISWMHGNSIEIDWDQNLILSNRASSEVLKIHRVTGEVIWVWGGPLNEFEIIDDPLGGFSKQHDVRRLENGNILMFDNGTEHSPQISRVLEYNLDEDDKTAELVWEYIHPAELVSGAMGSSQRLSNGNTLINWGTLNTEGAIITEVDYDQNILLEIRYPLEFKSYKVRKSDWTFDINLTRGDLNLDDLVNVVDILLIVQYIMAEIQAQNMFHLYKADMNLDGSIDVADVILVVNQIL